MSDHVEWFGANGGAGAVRGFLSAIASQMLSRLLTLQLERDEHGSLVEIGTYMGKTFVGLAKASRADEPVIGFDLFPGDMKTAFLASLEHLTAEQKARLCIMQVNSGRMTAAEWIQHLKRPARFIHIDGEHTYGGVARDLDLAACHLSAGALIVVDDFLHDWYPDVTEGVLAGLRALTQIAPVAVIPRHGPSIEGGTKLVCSTSASAKTYRDFFETEYAAKRPRIRPLAGRPVVVFEGN